ncbi:2,3-bisphosphoglycerate-independent phosphoglycerate mutase [Carboxydochorda subterranea]|uniref:2,3-bisphosphoglycerate-independent phosphoglycerate mutase n=1 Tax=Carboxydichorda subterranea TaxID=3109565 RepID=A0ABZ1BWK0_9FIRM|nr:2,3-bisphosphoglycerate-independent phosphoglycerate mutase [Limnochorda sp. L945t]WRP17054.1 2,3-bisphosphoglycerate-independent phosphoglycerate mutase [Limnochorda sp. L945t]
MEPLLEFLQPLAQSGGKTVLLVMDGLGGLPHPETGLTELEAARTPHMDALAKDGSCGLSMPVAPGVTPGSGPGHLALFGYDPQRYVVGRGVLSALGVGLSLGPQDVAARANFATREGDIIVDRRAGRISTEECRRLAALLNERIRLDGVSVHVEPEMQHRAVVIFSGPGLSPHLSDSDPQKTGVPAPEVRPTAPEAEKTAAVVNEFIRQAYRVLEHEHPANAILLRGFDRQPALPQLPQLFGIRAVAIAYYPMYRGLARLVGMETVVPGPEPKDAIAKALELWEEHDLLFIHVKGTDSAGEDGDWARKSRVIEAVDAALPPLIERKPDVLLITGDHSTPAALKMHSWHPVPVLLWARTARKDRWIQKFGESECARGSLGQVRAVELLPLMLAHAGRLVKFGA